MSIWTTIFGTPDSLSEFWQASYRMKRQDSTAMRDGEKLYKYQCDKLAASLLIKDNAPDLTIDVQNLGWLTHFTWIDKGELISGSFIASEIAKSSIGKGFEVGDIDIYFHSRSDAIEFCVANKMQEVNFVEIKSNDICVYFTHKSLKFNLIWGVEYDSPEHLISRFDIRACSMAFDPISCKLYTVNGAIDDAIEQRIIFNPVPRATSLSRLVKYTKKGFLIDKYQRLFFAQLIRSDIYSSELELTTGYEVKSPR